MHIVLLRGLVDQQSWLGCNLWHLDRLISTVSSLLHRFSSLAYCLSSPATNLLHSWVWRLLSQTWPSLSRLLLRSLPSLLIIHGLLLLLLFIHDWSLLLFIHDYLLLLSLLRGLCLLLLTWWIIWLSSLLLFLSCHPLFEFQLSLSSKLLPSLLFPLHYFFPKLLLLLDLKTESLSLWIIFLWQSLFLGCRCMSLLLFWSFLDDCLRRGS